MVSVNGIEIEWQEEMTVQKLLQIMNYTFPMIVVTVNGIPVDRAQWPVYMVPDKSVVQAHHLIAGG